MNQFKVTCGEKLIYKWSFFGWSIPLISLLFLHWMWQHLTGVRPNTTLKKTKQWLRSVIKTYKSKCNPSTRCSWGGIWGKMAHNPPYVALFFLSISGLLTVVTHQQTQTQTPMHTHTPGSVWSLPMRLDSAIYEHYWISTGWTNRSDAAGCAGGQSQTAGKSIRTRDLGNIGKAAV